MKSMWIAVGLGGILGVGLGTVGVPSAAAAQPALPAPPAPPLAASAPAAPPAPAAPAKLLATPTSPGKAPSTARTPAPVKAATPTRAATVPSPPLPATLDTALIPAYKTLSPTLAVGGQPSSEAIAELHAWGFRTVINLRTDAEGAASEKAPVEAQGLRYVSIPVTPATLGWETARAVVDALAVQGAAPVLLHCASSNRVGAIWALAERLKGKTVEEALAAGRNAGMTSDALVERVRLIAEGTPPARVPAPVPPTAASAPRR